MDKKQQRNPVDTAFDIFMSMLVVSMLTLGIASIVSQSRDQKKQEDFEAKVAAYTKNFPNYTDSLNLYVSANSKNTAQWRDAIKTLPVGAKRDTAAAKLGYYISKCEEYAAKQADVDLRIVQYRDSVMNGKIR